MIAGFSRMTVAALAIAILAARAGAADAPAGAAEVTQLLTKELPDLPNKEVVMLTVGYLPGGSSLPHRHDAHVFVYVLEGALRMQVAGHDPVMLTPGQVFYEGPDDVHQTSANASATQPAKFLVVVLKDRDRPLSQPAAPESAR